MLTTFKGRFRIFIATVDPTRIFFKYVDKHFLSIHKEMPCFVKFLFGFGPRSSTEYRPPG